MTAKYAKVELLTRPTGSVCVVRVRQSSYLRLHWEIEQQNFSQSLLVYGHNDLRFWLATRAKTRVLKWCIHFLLYLQHMLWLSVPLAFNCLILWGFLTCFFFFAKVKPSSPSLNLFFWVCSCSIEPLSSVKKFAERLLCGLKVEVNATSSSVFLSIWIMLISDWASLTTLLWTSAFTSSCFFELVWPVFSVLMFWLLSWRAASLFCSCRFEVTRFLKSWKTHWYCW